MEEIKKALDRIAEGNALGEVSDDLLIKACDAYKIKSENFDDSYDYHVCVAKSLLEEGFQRYLESYNISVDAFMKMKNTDKSDKLMNWLNHDCIDFSQLTIK